MTTSDVPRTWSLKDKPPAEVEDVVLHHVIAVHPDKVTLDELIREIEGENPSFGDRDCIQIAARELSGVGLLHLRDGFISPTRAALRYAALQEGCD